MWVYVCVCMPIPDITNFYDLACIAIAEDEEEERWKDRPTRHRKCLIK